jgi:hypothetical protein
MDTAINVPKHEGAIDYSKIEHYIAVIETGIVGGSWAVSKTSALDAINRVVYLAKQDWKIYGRGYVHVYDVTHSERFTTEGHPHDVETGKPLPYLYSVLINIPKRRTPGVKARK